MIKRILNPILMPYWWQDLLLALPRIGAGVMLTLFFGAPKFGMPWSPVDNNLGLFEVAFWFPNDVAKFGGIFKMMPSFFAWMAAFSEAVGGLFLIFGLNTRIFSFLCLCTMLVAAFCQQMQSGYWNMLPSLGFACLHLFNTIQGSGRFGLDYLISKKLK
jgi:putative oxidoreductase